MPTIWLTRGLPGSGKTHWAKGVQAADPNTVLVSKDDLRSMLHSGKWSKANEKQVLTIRDEIIASSIRMGRQVIVHDTNLVPIHEIRIKELAADLRKEGLSVKVEINDFTDVPIETCIKNDLNRLNSVGEAVIRKMHREHLAGEPTKYVPFSSSRNADLPDAIIVDIDGTLAHMTNRGPYDTTGYLEDLVDEAVLNVVNLHADCSYRVIVCSGREDIYQAVTEEWLAKNGVKYDHLFMRPAGDKRKDYIVKEEIYNKYIKDQYNILFILEDRKSVMEMWRSLGLKVLHVDFGDF